MQRNPLVNPRAGDVVVFLHAHPDDESIFTGGTIARPAAARADVIVITATLGERGRPSDPLVRAELGDDAPLAAVRNEELRSACATLGASDVVLLGTEGRFLDSGVRPDDWCDRSLARSRHAAAGALVSVLRDIRPHLLVTFDADGCTGHPDHLACYDIATSAAAALAAHDDRLCGLALIRDPRPRCRTSTPARADLAAVDVRAVRKRKAAAVSCHFSQVGNAVDDRARLDEYDVMSAVAQYLPLVLSNRAASEQELYSCVPTERLLATARRIGNDLVTSQPVSR